MEKRNNDIPFIRTDAGKSLTETYVKAIAHRYHYEWKDIKKMRQVAAQIRTTVEAEEGFYLLLPEAGSNYAGVALTLGHSLDALQENYTRQEDIEGAYMIEVIAGELMRNAYLQFSDYIMEHTCYEVGAFHFFGSRPELPLKNMQKLLEKIPGAAVDLQRGILSGTEKKRCIFSGIKTDGRKNKKRRAGNVNSSVRSV